MDRDFMGRNAEAFKNDPTILRQLRAIVSVQVAEGAPLDANNNTRYWGYGGGWLDAQETNEVLKALGLIEAPESSDHGDHDFARTKATSLGIFTALTGELPDPE